MFSGRNDACTEDVVYASDFTLFTIYIKMPSVRIVDLREDSYAVVAAAGVVFHMIGCVVREFDEICGVRLRLAS